MIDPEKLKQISKARGYTQKELCDRPKVSKTWVYKMQKGNVDHTSKEIVEDLARALSCELSDIAEPYCYTNPVTEKQPLKFRDHTSIDPKIFNIGKRYLINGEKLILEQRCFARNVIHYLFIQPMGGWRISYTSIDFRVGDVAVQQL